MCNYCGYEDLIDEMDDMLLDESYDYASDFISGVLEWVKENSHCTDKQKEAIERIEPRDPYEQFPVFDEF